MLHTWLPDNTIKLRFRDIFDDLGVAVLTHDENAKTLRLGPGYSILDENGSPLGAGGGGGGLSGSGVANQIAFWTDTDELGGNAGFTFDPSSTTDDNLIFQVNVVSPDATGNHHAFTIADTFQSELMSTGAGGVALRITSTSAGTFDINNQNGLTVFMTSNTSGAHPYSAAIEVLQNAVFSMKTTPDKSYGLVVGDQISALESAGIWVKDISGGATNNYAIKTGAGDVQLGTLAGSGTRYVTVDDNGKLVAGAAV